MDSNPLPGDWPGVLMFDETRLLQSRFNVSMPTASPGVRMLDETRLLQSRLVERLVAMQKDCRLITSSEEHWMRMLRSPNQCFRDGEHPSSHYCALCMRYNYKAASGKSCVGCPIWIRTGLYFCCGTPYERARKAWNNYHTSPSPSKERLRLLEEWVKFAGEMVVYLVETRNQIVTRARDLVASFVQDEIGF